MRELTLLLLLKDRESFSKRWISYFEKSSLNINVFIADGSKSKNDLFNHNELFNYHYFGPDKDFTTYRNKVIQSLKMINTKYVLFASNDDFYIKSGIQQALKILKRNKNYSACRGLIKSFRVTSKDGLFGKLVLNEDLYTSTSILGNNASKRILEFINKSNSIWHDVVKKEEILSAWSNSKKYKFENILIHDLYTYFYISSRGKCIRSKYIYMLHQNHPDSLGHDSTYEDIEFKIAQIISKTSMGKNFVNEICRLANITTKNKANKFKSEFLAHFYSEYLLKRIENKQALNLKKTFMKKIKSNLASKYAKLYSIYSFLKYIQNPKNQKNINKYNLNLIDDFLRKRI
tara:strand:+ start:27 stop:1064 length:1038 start_codon:yes stop_codon:yes gene_type:complete